MARDPRPPEEIPMKRSAINERIRNAKAFLGEHRFLLPPFAAWSAAQWRQAGPDAAEIVDNQLGWDVTDFGSGDFDRCGLLLVTLRNGHPDNLDDPGAKTYAEKIMVVRENQVTPMHFHTFKTEDIINRGGGTLRIRVYNATDEDALAESEVVVQMDGITRTFDPGTEVPVRPGESMTIPPRLYHAFWAEEGGGTALVGEVSRVNDDRTDNHFLEPAGRFPAIDEDAEPIHLLVSDYEQYYYPESKE
jgi:D-lyxose ketol-isomerase